MLYNTLVKLFSNFKSIFENLNILITKLNKAPNIIFLKFHFNTLFLFPSVDS